MERPKLSAVLGALVFPLLIAFLFYHGAVKHYEGLQWAAEVRLDTAKLNQSGAVSRAMLRRLVDYSGERVTAILILDARLTDLELTDRKVYIYPYTQVLRGPQEPQEARTQPSEGSSKGGPQ